MDSSHGPVESCAFVDSHAESSPRCVVPSLCPLYKDALLESASHAVMPLVLSSAPWIRMMRDRNAGRNGQETLPYYTRPQGGKVLDLNPSVRRS